MNPLTFHHLTKTECHNPQLALSCFRRRNDLHHLRTQLWMWLRETLAAKNTIYDCPEQRDELLHTYEELNRLLEATYLCQNERAMKNDPTTNLQRRKNESPL